MIFRVGSPLFQKERQSAGLVEIAQQGFRRLEVGGVESLGKPVVHWPQQPLGVGGSALIAQQASKARGGAQFPRKGALPARPVERLPKVIFRRRRGAGCGLRHQQLALEPQ